MGAGDSKDVVALEAFAARYEETFYGEGARPSQSVSTCGSRQRAFEAPSLAQLSEPAEAWDKIRGSKDVAALEAFSARYTGTVYAELARARIQALRK
jgi:hypothetical protein